MADLTFAALVALALMGWAFWLYELAPQWFLIGFANWFVRRLHAIGLIANGIAYGASYGLSEYRRVRRSKRELINESEEVMSIR